jgi:GNAT superfamily N-acetyltransferase
MSAFTLHLHDDTLPAHDVQVVDDGLGDANLAAAPLHEVRALGCFAHDDAGQVVGGAVGRTWGACCELQQLWVQPGQRGAGLGTALLRAFEARAAERGCQLVYLETFSFQAPDFYRRGGYETVHASAHFPHGIVKHLMQRRI